MSEKCHSILFDRKGRLLSELASVSADLGDGHVIPEHYHPEDQLLFASKGVMTVRTREGVWVVPPLRAVWIPAETPHSVAMSGPVSMRTLYLLPGLCRNIPAKCFVMNVSLLLKELILHACSFQRLNKRVSTERRIVEIIVDQLKAIESIPLQLPYPADSRAARVAKALTMSPADQRPLEKLCKDCGASKRTIQRLFLEETKMTFGRWRQQLRLLHAMQVLASGEKVTTAALEAGYGSTSAFISMFRKHLGTTPKRYLKDGTDAATVVRRAREAASSG
ncbi:MAG TPA: helix-turn-helix transcriptional regulator [Candidatus Acidoferrales bacterium]|nr:helix-turn-helix transcriptional regulator [Candidatus Acidoferrales bacterium]